MYLQLHQLLSYEDQIICASSITLSKIRNLFRNRKKVRVKSLNDLIPSINNLVFLSNDRERASTYEE